MSNRNKFLRNAYVKVPSYLTRSQAEKLAEKVLRSEGRKSTVQFTTMYGDLEVKAAIMVETSGEIASLEKRIRGAFLGKRPQTQQEINERTEQARQTREYNKEMARRNAISGRLAKAVEKLFRQRKDYTVGFTSTDELPWARVTIVPSQLKRALKVINDNFRYAPSIQVRYDGNYTLQFETKTYHIDDVIDPDSEE